MIELFSRRNKKTDLFGAHIDTKTGSGRKHTQVVVMLIVSCKLKRNVANLMSYSKDTN